MRLKSIYAEVISVIFVLLFVVGIVHATGLDNDKFSKYHEITPPDDVFADAAPVCTSIDSGTLVVWISNVENSLAGSDLKYALIGNDGSVIRGNITFTVDGSERDINLIKVHNESYLIWSTNSPSCTHGTDWDIVISHFNGINWEDPVEISPGDDLRDDFYPYVCFISSTIYVSWIATDGNRGSVMLASYNTENNKVTFIGDITSDWKGSVMSVAIAPWYGNLMFACVTNDTVYTHGSDYDIITFVYTSSGITQMTELSDPDDSSDDIHPYMLYKDGMIYLAWQTSDKTITDGDDDDIVMATFNGSWSPVREITKKGDSGDDSFPLLYIYEGEVFIMWNSDDPSLTSGTDWDVVTGPINGPFVEITPVKDGGYDDGDYYTRGYDAIEYDTGIFFVLETNNPGITSGKDRDIVYLTYNFQFSTDSSTSSSSDSTYSSSTPDKGVPSGSEKSNTTNPRNKSDSFIPGLNAFVWTLSVAFTLLIARRGYYLILR